jgi:hypothetical protein
MRERDRREEEEERGKARGAVGPLVRLTKLVCSLRCTEWPRIGLMTGSDECCWASPYWALTRCARGTRSVCAPSVLPSSLG